jgi:integrase
MSESGPLERRQGAAPQSFLFCMAGERQITSLADHFDKNLKLARMKTNAHGKNCCLDSLHHYNACDALRRNISPYMLAKNMGTSVAIIKQYYGKSATAETLSRTLAD